jgi:hypothetical protein
MRQFLIALDQLGNTLVGGWADETLSSHAYRLHRDKKAFGFMMHIINTLFFWEPDHCQRAFESERLRNHLDPEFRK